MKISRDIVSRPEGHIENTAPSGVCKTALAERQPRGGCQSFRWLFGYSRECVEPWSIRARQPPNREFDAVVGEDAPALDLSLVGCLGEPAQHLARLRTRGFARQGEGIAPEAVPVLALGKDLGGPAGDVDGAAAINHGSPRPSI